MLGFFGGTIERQQSTVLFAVVYPHGMRMLVKQDRYKARLPDSTSLNRRWLKIAILVIEPPNRLALCWDVYFRISNLSSPRSCPYLILYGVYGYY